MHIFIGFACKLQICCQGCNRIFEKVYQAECGCRYCLECVDQQ